ncbi:MAG TPA: SPOR domain-containing protein [Burkholderiales bacterium]|nr:SPOR domain-containing protein [Burkholderiales bacterium]
MAKSISDEALQLRKRARRRLIGAIALVTLIAVVLPMVLDTEPRPPIGQNVDIQIPSPDSGTFASKVVPSTPSHQAVAPAQPETGKTAAVKPAPAEPAKPAQAKVAPAPAEASKPATAKAAAAPQPAASASAPPAAQKAAAPAAGEKAFVIQIAALADAEKAQALQTRLSDNGIKSYTQVISTKAGPVTRVRAGPFAARDEAERAQEKLKELGLKGSIAPQ